MNIKEEQCILLKFRITLKTTQKTKMIGKAVSKRNANTGKSKEITIKSDKIG